jgi:hypothetical protein
MNNHNLTQAIERLCAINWKATNDNRQRSHIALVEEYLRRSVLWAKALKDMDSWPFFDVALHILPEAQIPEHLINQVIDKLSVDLWVERICKLYLHWAYLKDQPEITAFNLPDPYEPLIRLYERGGRFTTEHGFLYVGLADVPRRDWRKYDLPNPIVALDDASLDQLDAQPERKAS